MKTYASEPFETYALSGQELRIRWNQTSFDKDGQTVYEADETVCNFMDSRASLIQKIIGEVYDVGSEIAVINNKENKPEEYAKYQAFRQQAKDLADSWINRG